MFYVFNIGAVLLVLLIAYWWANQGLFSALLHLLCVVAAGAVALAVWEPLTLGLLIRGNAFDNYAWGVCLIGVFAAVLLVLRVIMDKSIGSNVDLPHWANLVFGFPVGAAAGILTIGIMMIGAGYIQSGRELMGFTGYARSNTRAARIEPLESMWAPFHEWTSQFYSYLSVASLSSSRPLRQYTPQLHRQAWSLVRDSYNDGRGKLSLGRNDARVETLVSCPEANRYAVRVTFLSGARDYGEQLTLSNAQVRLIGDAAGQDEAPVAYPDGWVQYDGYHRFDDASHYVTSEPAQMEAKVLLMFNRRDLGTAPPRFIQIRGTRFRLPAMTTVDRGSFEAIVGGKVDSAGAPAATVDAGAKPLGNAIEQTNSIRPIVASTNQTPHGIDITENFISGGDGEFSRNNDMRPARQLMIKGILESAGTRIVQVNISRGGPGDIFGGTVQRAGDTAQLTLVDNLGRIYLPVGFIHNVPDGKTRVKVDFQNYVRTAKELPMLPTSGTHELRLLFSVREGVTVVGFRVGDITVGTCKLQVQDPKGKVNPFKDQ